MPLNIGILCSENGLELAVLIAAVDNKRLPAEIKIVIADRNSGALKLAREVGLPGVFIPRTAFHANRDAFEGRLVEIFQEAEVEYIILAGYAREVGPVLSEAYEERILGQDLCPEELVPELEKKLRGKLFSLA